MPEPFHPPGRLVVLEGIDGCGKSTQLQALSAWLPASGLLPPGASLVRTREPGGTPGEALRQLLLHPPWTRPRSPGRSCCSMPPTGPSMWSR